MARFDPAQGKGSVSLAESPLPNAVKALDNGTLRLPTGQDFHFYSNFQDFKGPVANLQRRVVALLDQLGSLEEVRSRPSKFPAELDEGYDWLVGVQDDFLERVDASLEKFQFETKEHFTRKSELNAYEAASKQRISRISSKFLATEDIKSGDVKVARSKDKAIARSPVPFHIPSIPRPQDKFDQAVDNSNAPFRHPGSKRRSQQDPEINSAQGHEDIPQLQIPLESSAVSAVPSLEKHARTLGFRTPESNAHPLEEELLKMAYVEDLPETLEIRKYDSLENTPFTLVTTVKALKEMAFKLQTAGEIAIDLENHHYRSYQGFVCLMQVSTRNEDFVVDTLDLRSQIGPILGEIFSDPAIKKVMHGAEHDIFWLQRDFSVYVCNLFDTGQAARVLKLPGFGLAFLLEHFCEVHADKRYQLADWRIRPLPSEMLKYAREDTHYLLYVHDMLKQQLLAAQADGKVDEENPLLQVYERSRDICLQLYSKELFTENSYQQIYGLHEKKFLPEQVAVLADLYRWRDQIARKEDESTGYVMPNHLLFQLVTAMPDNVRQLQSLLKGPNSMISRNAAVVVQIIRQAKEKALRKNLDCHPLLEVQNQRGESSTEVVHAIDRSEGEVGQKDHSVPVEETSSKLASNSGEREMLNSDTMIVTNILQPGSLMKPSEDDRTRGNTSKKSDICLSGARVSDDADALVCAAMDGSPDINLGVVQLNLTSMTLPGPVVVTRKKSSSFFNTRPPKILPLPVPSSIVSMPVESVNVSDGVLPPAILCPVEAGYFPSSSDHVTPEALATHPVKSLCSDKGQLSDPSRGQTISETSSAIDTESDSIESSTGGSLCLPREVPVEGLAYRSSALPERSFPLVPLKPTEEDSEIQVSSTVANTSSVQAPDEQKHVENVLAVQLKRKPSKLGALLGGNSRLQSAKDLKQVQARIKTQSIESSLILPFSTPIHLLPGVSETITQPNMLGEAEVLSRRTEEKIDSCFEELGAGAGGSLSERTVDGQAHSTPPLCQDVLMFESKADEDSANGESESIMSGGTVIGNDLEQPQKVRKWWPSASENFSLDRSLALPGPHAPASDQSMEGPSSFMTSQLPLSLSEMHRNSKSRKKKRSRPDHSGECGHPDVSALDSSLRGRGQYNKRQRGTSLSREGDLDVNRGANIDTRIGVGSFNYNEARKVLGLEDLYAGKAEDREGTSNRGRGRGSKRGGTKFPTSLNKSAFDPLKRVREEPRAEGIQPGQRRQVFPQTGNRTIVFKQ